MTVRDGPRFTRGRFATPEELFSELERRCDELARGVDKKPVDMLFRKLEPVEVVAARLEVIGPRRGLRGGVRGGIDIRADGSTEAFLGRATRKVIEPWPGETVASALRRCLGPGLA